MTEGTKVARSRRAEKWMRKRGWNYQTPRNGLRRRLWSLASNHQPWWDWGNRLMVITGSDMGGSWDEPTAPTWWYRLGDPKRMPRTGYPTHPISTMRVVTDYDEFRAMTTGLDEDAMYQWHAFCIDQDGALQLGKRYWGGDFCGLNRWEIPLLYKYLRMVRRHGWFGVRGWLYAQGLHAAVHRKRPFTCQQVPPTGSGGYSHWHCGEKRGHTGLHRFNTYQWGEIGGEQIGLVRSES